MRPKRKLPLWCKNVRKAMIDKDLGTNDLAEAMGITNVYASKIISGSLYPSDELVKKINNYLGIKQPEQMLL